MKPTTSIDTEVIKVSHPLADFFEARGVVLKREGATLKGKCPFHGEQHGTGLCIYPDDNRWHCFGACQTGGDIIKAVRLLDGLDFRAACEALSGGSTRFVSPIIKPTRPPKAPPAARLLTTEQRQQQADAAARLGKSAEALRDIAESRGWRVRTVRELALFGHLGLADAGTLAFVYPAGMKRRGSKGSNHVADILRAAKDDRRINWAFGDNGELWRRDYLKKGGVVIVCEGETDAICLLDSGLEADGEAVVVAMPSASSWRETWSTGLAGRDVVVVTDADDAGENAAASAMSALAGVASNVVRVSPADLHAGANDLGDVHKALGRDGLRAAMLEAIKRERARATVLQAAMSSTVSATTITGLGMESAPPLVVDVTDANNQPPPRPDAIDNGAALLSLLDARRVRYEEPPPPPVPVFSLKGQTLSTAGGLTVIQAQAKAGKTATLGGLLAAVMVADTTEGGDELAASWPDERGYDTLGFEAAPSEGKALVYLDTEQSAFDSWRGLERAVRRAGLDSPPLNLFRYVVGDLNTEQRRALLKLELERREAEGGIYAVILDGGADLLASVNDEVTAVGFVDELVALATRHRCPMLVVLHENPGDNTAGKTRGHLGSQLERKAESNVRLLKGADGVTQVYAERCRNCYLPKGQGVFFEWSDEAGMHVRVERETVDKGEAKREEATAQMEEVYGGQVGALRYGELKRLMVERLAIKDKTAEARIQTWAKLGVIRRNGNGYTRA